MAEGVVSGGPEELLRGALEKIVFFECRVSQLDAELSAARAVAMREKETVAAARTRELELETLLAQARSAQAAMKSRLIELEERVRLLEAERERFLSGMVERAQVEGAPGDMVGDVQGEQADLAGFIAEMRSEIERLKVWKSVAEKAGFSIEDGSNPVPQPSAPVPPVSTLAARFEKAGRLGVDQVETDCMKDRLATRVERSLYETSMEDLATADPARRKRAADCLRALGSHAAAPLVAAALGRESDGTVKAALLSALAAIGEPPSAALAFREISDSRPEVRAAALDAAAALAKDKAESFLVGALGDASSMVRRRAVLLLGFMPSASASDALASMLSDRDPGVARTAALALSGRANIRAQSALTKALDHREPAVRRFAADAVASWSGEKIDPNSPSMERRRAARRAADKLANLEEGALRRAVIKTAGAPAANSPGRAATPEQAGKAADPLPPNRQERRKSEDRRTVQAVIYTPPPKTPKPETENDPTALETVLVGEIRAALRGRSAEELSSLAGADPAEVEASLIMLVKRGSLSQRGSRFFIS